MARDGPRRSPAAAPPAARLRSRGPRAGRGCCPRRLRADPARGVRRHGRRRRPRPRRGRAAATPSRARSRASPRCPAAGTRGGSSRPRPAGTRRRCPPTGSRPRSRSSPRTPRSSPPSTRSASRRSGPRSRSRWSSAGSRPSAVWRLARCVAADDVAVRAAVLFCCFPGAVVLSWGYSEALAAALVAGCLVALHRRRWLLAGLAAAAGGATRLDVGLGLLVATAAAAARARGGGTASGARRRRWPPRCSRRSARSPSGRSCGRAPARRAPGRSPRTAAGTSTWTSAPTRSTRSAAW